MTRHEGLKVAAAAAGVTVILGWPTSAVASCLAPLSFPRAIEEAPAVFVGEVVDVSGGGRWATVEVRQVWKGGELPAEVEVRGGPRDENVLTSVDRDFKISRDYLFVPYERRGSTFLDNACTSTTRFRPELTRFRPANAAEASPTPAASAPRLDENDDGSRWLLPGAALAAVAVMALVILRGR